MDSGETKRVYWCPDCGVYKITKCNKAMKKDCAITNKFCNKEYFVIPKSPNRKVKIWEGKIILDHKDCQFYAVKSGVRNYIDFSIFVNKKGKLIFIED